MKIEQFINRFQNHPILFIGTGISLRYLENSYSWGNLLKTISENISGNTFHFQDLKNQAYSNETKSYDYAKIATILEKELDDVAEYKLGTTKPDYINQINRVYYDSMEKGVHASRMKIFISQLLAELKYKEDMDNEIDMLKKLGKI